jgi:hypothetical protein
MAQPHTIFGIEIKDFVTILALIIGPVVAVIITLWSQKRSEKKAAKIRLFVSLMTHRGSVPITAEWVAALNLIDVVYTKHRRVIEAWHDLYDYFHMKPLDPRVLAARKIELLSAMSRVIGYRSLRESDITRFYFPESHQVAVLAQQEVQAEFVRVLKSSEAFSLPARKPPPAPPKKDE